MHVHFPLLVESGRKVSKNSQQLNFPKWPRRSWLGNGRELVRARSGLLEAREPNHERMWRIAERSPFHSPASFLDLAIGSKVPGKPLRTSTRTTPGLPHPQYAQQTLAAAESCKIQDSL